MQFDDDVILSNNSIPKVVMHGFNISGNRRKLTKIVTLLTTEIPDINIKIIDEPILLRPKAKESWKYHYDNKVAFIEGESDV